MHLIIAGALWIGGWILLILNTNIFKRLVHNDLKIYRHLEFIDMLKEDSDDVPKSTLIEEELNSELVKDANNMFITGASYFIDTLICYFVQIPVLQWILCILGGIFILPPLFSCIFSILPQAVRVKTYGTTALFVSGMLSNIFQILIIINIVVMISK